MSPKPKGKRGPFQWRGRTYYPAGCAIRVSKVYDTEDDEPRKKVARVKA